LPGAASIRPDYVLEFGSAMGGMMGGGMMGGMGMHGVPSGTAEGGLRWTINGKSFPDTTPLNVQLGKVVKIRFINNDMTAMMGHRMDHPIHLHGTSFQIISENGRPPKRETWKDTVPVPAGQYVDVAFIMTLPGEWMLHCHIIDHEDGGMMTTLRAY
jgi:FtsP/CotA-like multicopper oxidase with cupredoxin domain